MLGTREQNTPASLVVDEDGLLDIEKLSHFDPEPDLEDDSEDSSVVKKTFKISVGPISGLLGLLRRPENLLLQCYYDSTLRNKLLNKFDWYRDFECETQFTTKLGNLYGTNSPLSHFFKNNILASLIIIAVCGQLFVNYLSRPVENRYAEKEQALTESVAQTEQEPDYSQILNHCAVTDGLRELYGGAGSLNVKNEVVAQVEGFIRVYNSSEIEQWYADQDSKRGMVVSQVQSMLPRIHRYRERLVAEISAIEGERDQLESRLETITTASSQGLNDINKSIKLRNELNEIEHRLTVGPNPETLDELDAQLERLNLVVTGDESLGRPVSDWARDTSAQDRVSLIDSVKDAIHKDIDNSIEQAAQGSPEARQYRLRTLTATLRHFGDLIGQLQNSSNYFEVNVGNRQNVINGRLRTLLGNEELPLVELLNYDNCLTALNSTQTKLTAQ